MAVHGGSVSGPSWLLGGHEVASASEVWNRTASPASSLQSHTQCYSVTNKSKTCAMFSVLPSCLAAKVRAEAPNPRSSLSDPWSSASDEWKECLLECTGDLLNDISDSQKKHLHWYSGHLSYICISSYIIHPRGPATEDLFFNYLGNFSSGDIRNIKSTLPSTDFHFTVAKLAEVPRRLCLTR